MSPEQSTVRRRKHLIDLSNPPPPSQRTSMSLTRVQQWVASVLVVTTVLHLAGGLVLAAGTVPGTRPYAREALLLIAAILGVLGLVGGLLIHRRKPWHPLALLGLLPALGGVWWFYLR